MPKCYILSGAPLSGKSTFAKNSHLRIISCDQLRFMFNGYKKYKYDPKTEDRVWSYFYGLLEKATIDFVIDNTNCRLKYINEIKKHLPEGYEVEIVKFEIPLWKSYVRNVLRYIKTGKWIPFKVIKKMKEDYKQLWKNE